MLKFKYIKEFNIQTLFCMNTGTPTLSETEKLKALIEETKKHVMAEIEEYKKGLQPGETWHRYLNNFMTRLPNRKYSEGSEMAYKAAKIGWENKTLGELEDSAGIDKGKRDPLHSKMYYSKTAKSILEDVFKAIQSTPEVSLEKIYELQEEEINATNEEVKLYPTGQDTPQAMRDRTIKAVHDLSDYTLPVYIELRVMGYSRKDLTG